MTLQNIQCQKFKLFFRLSKCQTPASPGFINFDSEQTLVRTIHSQNFIYQTEMTKTYQPIRMVRNAWDYSVETIGPAN